MALSTPSSGAGACFNDIDLARWTYQQCREKCRELGLTSTGLHSQLRYRLSKWCTSQSDVTGHPVTANPPDAPPPPPGNAQLVPSPFADYAPPPPPPPDDRLLFDGPRPKRSTEPPPNPVPTTLRRRMQCTDHTSPDETSETLVDDSDTETLPSTSVRRRRRQPPPTATAPTMDPPAVQFSTTISDPTDNGMPSHAPKDAALPDAACRRLRALSDRPTELELAQLRDIDLRALLATLGLPRTNRGGKAPMVSNLLQWLTERPSSPLPLPQGLQRTSRQAPASICKQIDGAVLGNGTPLRSSSPVETISLHDVDAPPQLPTFTPPQPSEPLSQSMDVDIPAQDTDRAPNQTNALVTQSAAPPLHRPSGLQSTTAPTSAPPPPSPRRSDPSYANIVSGVSSTPSTPPNTAGLVDILECA